jgi:small subunit ribosomal protein S21
MLIIEVGKDGIERALKKLKSKFNKCKIAKKCREKQAFEKPSVKRRAELLKAIYIEETYRPKE